MASTINATNTTSGVAITPDSSGILQLQTAGTAAVTVDASQNVGIGTTNFSNAKFTVGVGSNPTGTIATINTANANTNALLLSNWTGSTATQKITMQFDNSSIGSFTIGMPAATNAFYIYDTIASAERLRIDSSGNVLVTGGGGLGYGTGSGGTVTQLTNKNTNVTLNKTTGQIIMNNAALAAGVAANFVCVNSTVASTDCIIATLVGASVVDSNTYRLEVRSTTTGNIVFRLTNTSAGSLSEAVGINFAVIKGVTA